MLLARLIGKTLPLGCRMRMRTRTRTMAAVEAAVAASAAAAAVAVAVAAAAGSSSGSAYVREYALREGLGKDSEDTRIKQHERASYVHGGCVRDPTRERRGF
jgi:hypothetical protein